MCRFDKIHVFPSCFLFFSCASRVGRGGDKEQKLTIGSPALRCKVGNIIHELGHAIGFFHEHSRPDRNTFVRVLKKNILPGKLVINIVFFIFFRKLNKPLRYNIAGDVWSWLIFNIYQYKQICCRQAFCSAGQH